MRERWQFDLEGFRRAIAAKRSVKDLTMRQAATECGLSAATICRVETAGRHPDVQNVVAICEWLGVTVDAFVLRGREAERRKA